MKQVNWNFSLDHRKDHGHPRDKKPIFGFWQCVPSIITNTVSVTTARHQLKTRLSRAWVQKTAGRARRQMLVLGQKFPQAVINAVGQCLENGVAGTLLPNIEMMGLQVKHREYPLAVIEQVKQ